MEFLGLRSLFSYLKWALFARLQVPRLLLLPLYKEEEIP